MFSTRTTAWRIAGTNPELSEAMSRALCMLTPQSTTVSLHAGLGIFLTRQCQHTGDENTEPLAGYEYLLAVPGEDPKSLCYGVHLSSTGADQPAVAGGVFGKNAILVFTDRVVLCSFYGTKAGDTGDRVLLLSPAHHAEGAVIHGGEHADEFMVVISTVSSGVCLVTFDNSGEGTLQLTPLDCVKGLTNMCPLLKGCLLISPAGLWLLYPGEGLWFVDLPNFYDVGEICLAENKQGNHVVLYGRSMASPGAPRVRAVGVISIYPNRLGPRVVQRNQSFALEHECFTLQSAAIAGHIAKITTYEASHCAPTSFSLYGLWETLLLRMTQARQYRRLVVMENVTNQVITTRQLNHKRELEGLEQTLTELKAEHAKEIGRLHKERLADQTRSLALAENSKHTAKYERLLSRKDKEINKLAARIIDLETDLKCVLNKPAQPVSCGHEAQLIELQETIQRLEISCQSLCPPVDPLETVEHKEVVAAFKYELKQASEAMAGLEAKLCRALQDNQALKQTMELMAQPIKAPPTTAQPTVTRHQLENEELRQNLFQVEQTLAVVRNAFTTMSAQMNHMRAVCRAVGEDAAQIGVGQILSVQELARLVRMRTALEQLGSLQT